MANDSAQKIAALINELNQLLPKMNLSVEVTNRLTIALNNLGTAFKTTGGDAKTLAEVNSYLETMQSHLGRMVRTGLFPVDKAGAFIDRLRTINTQLHQIYRQPAGQTGSEFLAGRGGLAGTGEGLKEATTGVAEEAEKVKRSFAGIGATISNELLTAEEATSRLEQAVHAYGYTLEDIKSVQVDTSTGVSKVGLASTDTEGNVKRLTLSMNRLGRVTPQVASAFRTLGGQLARNIGQFARYTVAVLLIYGPLRLLSEQLQLVTQNQEELANIAIVVGDSQERLEGIFNAVADAADMAGESIDGVLQGYTQAIRATGDIEEEYERMRVANELLTDSLILSKLSTLDQAKAMDILVAALRQANVPLDQGRELLDRWVAVTKVANVDLRTIAESYAIVGTVAQNAGIEIGETGNELVGLIAVLAEQTQLSATQTGNALRAVIAGMRTDATERELRKLGIAVKDVTGELLPFMDIAKQISDRFERGLISEPQFEKLAKIIGGGIRRAGQVQMVVKNLDQAMQINKETSNKAGEAQEALGIKTNTLRGAVTRLGNAFQELAQTLGTDGGILDIATALVNIFTSLTKAITGVADVIGKNMPVLMAIGGMALLNKRGGINPLMSLGGFFDRRSIAGGNWATAQGGQIDREPYPGMGGRGGGFTSKGMRTAGYLGAGAATAIPAITNFLQGKEAQGSANIIGGTIGAAMGATFGPVGMVIGASIGSSIAEGFVTSVLEVSGDIGRAFLEGREQERGEEPTEGGETLEEAEARIKRELQELVGRKYLEDFGIQKDLAEVPFIRQVTGGVIGMLGTGGAKIGDWIATEILGKEGYKERTGAEITEAKLMEHFVETFAPEKHEEYQQYFKETGKGTEDWAGEYGFTQRGMEMVERFAGTIDKIQEQLLISVNRRLLAGEITGKEARTQTDVVDGLDSALSGFLAATTEDASDAMIVLGDKTLTVSDAIEEYMDVFVNATDEQRDTLNQQIQTIRMYEESIELAIAANSNEVHVTDNLTVSMIEATQALEGFRTGLGEYTEELIKIQEFERHVTPTRVGLGMGIDWTPELMDTLMEFAQTFQKSYEEAMYEGNKELIATYRQTLPQVILESGFGEFQTAGQEVSAESIRKAKQYMEAEGMLPEDMGRQQPGFVEFDFNQDYFLNTFMPIYRELATELEKLGYMEEVADTIAIFGNKEMDLIHADNTIMQMILRSIEENTEDVVDGIYNLPTDASFMVPFTGYRFGFMNPPDYSSLIDEILRAVREIAQNTAPLGMAITDVPEKIQLPTDKIGEETPLPSTGYEFGPGEEATRERYRQRRAEDMREKHERLEARATFAGIGPIEQTPETGGIMDIFSTLNDILQRLLDAISTQVTEVKVDIDANFKTYLDGEVLADITQKYLVDDMQRKSGVSGINVSGAI